MFLSLLAAIFGRRGAGEEVRRPPFGLFLSRLKNLETGKDRPKASHKKDLEAVAKLAQRGIDEAERERVAA